MFTVMTWNLENFERPAAGASEAASEQYAGKLKQISELITAAGPTLVGVQEVLASHADLALGVSRTSSRRWAQGGPGACPSGPTNAASAWGGCRPGS